MVVSREYYKFEFRDHMILLHTPPHGIYILQQCDLPVLLNPFASYVLYRESCRKKGLYLGRRDAAEARLGLERLRAIGVAT